MISQGSLFCQGFADAPRHAPGDGLLCGGQEIVLWVGELGDKPALVGWAKRETAACAVRNLDLQQKMLRSGGPGAAVDWLKRIPDYTRDASADLGSAVHAAAEAIARGEPVPVDESLRPCLAAYRRDFLETFAPRFLAVEAMASTTFLGSPTAAPGRRDLAEPRKGSPSTCGAGAKHILALPPRLTSCSAAWATRQRGRIVPTATSLDTTRTASPTVSASTHGEAGGSTTGIVSA